jgi:hypothetical protein
MHSDEHLVRENMFYGLPRSARTPVKYNNTVYSRSDRIVRLDAETVASFAWFHAKSHVELLSVSSIARRCNAAVPRAK